MNILITYAVDPEFAPWPKLCKFEKVKAGSFTIQRARIGSTVADFLVTGMGPEYAQRAMESVPLSYDACVCAGYAGALRREYQVGDIFIPGRIEQAGQSAAIHCDPRLVESVKSMQPARMLLSSSKVIASAAEKRGFASIADAVDMESFTVVSAAHAQGIPAVAIRVISDTQDQGMPVDFSKSLDDKGQVSTAAVLRLLAGEPSKLAALMRLGRQSKIAAEALTQFLFAYIQGLPNGPDRNTRPFAEEAHR